MSRLLFQKCLLKRRFPHSLILLAAVPALLLLNATSLRSQMDKVDNILVAISGTGGSYIPLFVAQDAGIFKKYSIDARFVVMGGRATYITPLLSGDAQIAETSGSSSLAAIVNGAELTIVAQIANGLVFLIVGKPGLKNLADLRGKKLGVTRIGTGGDFAARYVLRRAGLNPVDVTTVAVGDQMANLLALKGGTIDAAVLNMTTYMVGKKSGLDMNLLADMGELKADYLHTAAVIKKSLLRAQPELIQRYLKAKVEAYQYSLKNRERTLEIMRVRTRNNDREALQATYDYFMGKFILKFPFISEAAVRTSLEEVALELPQAKNAKPKTLVDFRPMQELEQSGFLRPFTTP